MRIIVDRFKDGTVQVSFDTAIGEDPPSFDGIFASLLTALDGVIEHYIKSVKPKDESKFRENLYDHIDDMFGNLLSKVFPEIKPNEFDLTPAAIVYAQDMLISQAEKEGKTYKQVLKEYEDKAKRYINERSKIN